VARFDLYNERKWWWWYYYLSLAASKGTAAHIMLEGLVIDVVEYEDNYESNLRKEVLSKYNVKTGSL